MCMTIRTGQASIASVFSHPFFVLNIGLLLLGVNPLCLMDRRGLRLEILGLEAALRLHVHTSRPRRELASSLLRAERSGDCDTHGDDGRRNAHDGAVGLHQLARVVPDEVALGERVHDLGRGAADHVAQLVGDTRETAPECGGRQLVQVDWDHAPRALHEELHEEARGGQRALSSGENPGGNQSGGDEGRADDGAAAPEPLAYVAQNCTTDTSTGLHEDGSSAGAGVVQALLRNHERSVAVLGGVAVV